MAERVLLAHDVIDRLLKFLERPMQTVRDSQLLEVQPEALNGIEKWTIFGQPDDQQSVFVQAQRCSNSFAVMIGRVIHHQNQVLTRVLGQQVFKKSDEGIAVFVGGGEVTDASTVPVVRTKHM